MKKFVLSALILATISPAWAGAGKPVASVEESQADAAALNGAFRDIAKALASTLQDPESRKLIKEATGKKFDGDFDVLYRDIANRRVGNGKAFRQALGLSLAKVHGRPDTTGNRAAVQADLDRLTAALPTLQIAVPAGFADWDAESSAPLVTYVPEGVDDDEIEMVEAFDAAGESYMLSAQTEPTETVVVVGLNERTDENGYLVTPDMCPVEPLSTEPSTNVTCYDPYDPYDPGGDNPYEPTEPIAPPPPGPCDARTHSYGDKEVFYQIKINDDHEPWIKGSPEIYATYSMVDNTGIKGQYHMGNVDNTGTWYTINGHLFYWQSHFGNTLAMAIWEKDGTNWGTFSYSYSGFSYTVTINDGDDQLGGNPVSFFDPNCGYYSTGDAEFKLRHQAP
jgi:hypothetical protein